MKLLDRVFSSKPSKADFAAMAIEAFGNAGLVGLEYHVDNFSLKRAGSDATIFLQNSYVNYCGAGRAERQEIVAKMVASLSALPEIPRDFAAARKNLMPVIRDEAYEGMTMLLSGGETKAGFERQYKPFAAGLLAGLAYDTEHSITSVNLQTLESWGVDFDKAFAVAKENLRERTRPDGFESVHGVYWARWGDSYDSSRMLLTELIYRLPVDGDAVAFVPNRDALMVTGTNNIAGLRVMLNTGVDSHFKQGHPVSPDLFVLEDGAWKHYIPEDRGLREVWETTRRQRDGMDYNQQKDLLDKVHEKEGVDIFVAGYRIGEPKGDKPFSICVWSKDVDSLLPVTESIAFMVDPEKGDFFMVRWEAAVAVVGNLMEEDPELIPKRIRVREFPNREQIAELRNRAIALPG